MLTKATNGIWHFFMKKFALSHWAALVTMAVIVFVRIQDPLFVESMRLRYFDTLITSKAPSPNNIWTVNIDEQALEQLGQWPLPRGVYAQLIRDLYARHAGLVVMDVLMAEPDRMGQDQALAQALSEYPVVLTNVASDHSRNQPRNPVGTIINSQFQGNLISYRGIISNIRDLESAAAGVGSINTLPEIEIGRAHV